MKVLTLFSLSPRVLKLQFVNSANINTTIGGMSTLDGDFGDGWNLQAGVYFESHGERRGETNNSESLAGIVSNPDGQFGEVDPLWVAIDPNRDNGLLYDAFGDLKSEEDNTHASVDAFLSNEFFELPGGMFVVAGFGTSFSTETYKQTADEVDKAFNSGNQPVYTEVLRL